ncbi:T9SS type A sorting domain-containing protein [Adhaeribacter arboris]|nr:T9SS type A sorting domain-containing protein [Adhaeribacter arboris]
MKPQSFRQPMLPSGPTWPRLAQPRLLLLLLFLCLPLTSLWAQPAIAWDKTFGGSSSDNLRSLQHTRDGGYILGGRSRSEMGGDKTEAGIGDMDYWVVKLKADGTKEWDKTIGSSGFDDLRSLQQTSDGGYILGGISFSGPSGDKTEVSKGNYDYWVVKLKADGTIAWDKTIGGSGFDDFRSLQQTSDGGYILGGSSDSEPSGDKTQASKGSADYWVVKLKADGTKEWDKTIGSSGFDDFRSLQQTSDGGYILGGISFSRPSGDKTEVSKGNYDYWVVKLKADGTIAWDKTIGGSGFDGLESLQQTSDGGYILGGRSSSEASGDKTEVSKGNYDYWVVKLKADGTKEWDKTIGSSGFDDFRSLQQTSDGGYILGGSSDSEPSGDKTQASKGNYDYWVVKLKADGTKEWDKTIGGSDEDILFDLQQTSDGGYILGGSSSSEASGDKTQASKGSEDYWVVKLTSKTPALTSISAVSTIGGQVTLTGQNLSAVTAVKVGNSTYSNLEINSAGTQIRFNLPTGCGQNLKVVALAGTVESNALSFSYTNQTPELSAIIVSANPLATNSTLTANTTVKDENLSSAVWNWGDGSTSPATLKSSTISGSHKYTKAGTYSPVLTVTDACGQITSATYEYVVVYESGAITGAGGFTSPKQAYKADTKLTGAAVFGLFARFKKGTSTPEGSTLFAFKAGKVKLAFCSTVYETLTISGTKARYTGKGKINGQGNYGFLVSLIDGRPDKFRIKIWNKDKKNQVVYDNNLSNTADAADPVTTIVGFIMIQTSKAAVARMSLPGVEVTPEEKTAPTFRNYPNPFSEKTTLEFTFDEDEEYTLAIYDLAGKLVSQLPNGKAEAGKLNQVEWPAAQHPTGVYLARLSTGKAVQHLKLVIQ